MRRELELATASGSRSDLVFVFSVIFCSCTKQSPFPVPLPNQAELFNEWITLSTGQITIQWSMSWISVIAIVTNTNCAIQSF